jgi:ATP-dependent Clp protease ATP-binding subunit ClpX
MIPEFVGRFPSVVPLSELDRDALIAILTEVNGNLVNQYKTLFSQENIELHITKNALEEIADRTLASGTGARGLHSNMEKTLLPHMFEIIRYRDNKIDKITVNKELVENPASLIDKKFYYF